MTNFGKNSVMTGMNESTGAMNSEWATNYHESVDDLRREYVKAALMHQKAADTYSGRDLANVAEKHALLGNAMAANYAYTLAALLRVAREQIGGDAARILAFEADELITNGDFDDLNADLA